MFPKTKVSEKDFQVITEKNVSFLPEYMIKNALNRIIITPSENGIGWNSNYLPNLEPFNFIEELSVHWTKIDNIKGIEVCKNVKTLLLDNGDKTFIDFREFHKLERVFSWDRKGIEKIWNIPTLKDLSLAGLKRNHFQNGIALDTLEKLRIIQTPLEDISFLLRGKNIYFLELLGMSKLDNLDIIGNMTNLTHLGIEANKVRDFSFIRNLINLERCFLCSKSSEMCLEDFLNFKKIKSLNISGNEKTRIINRAIDEFYNFNEFPKS